MSNAFFLDKAKVKQSFSAASATYDSVADLQRQVGEALLNTFQINNSGGVLLDLGCGTGFLTDQLLNLTPDSKWQAIVALDIAWPMLQKAHSKLSRHQKVNFLCADAELLPIAEQSVDTVISNLALQWCRNPEAFFADIKRIIKRGGQLVFSTFGDQTLQELKNAWSEVDDYCHVNEFYNEQQLQQFLQSAGFSDIQAVKKSYCPTYDSVLALMQELKSIGAHNVLAGRNKNLTTKTQMQNMMAAYEMHRFDNRIPATFTAILVSAKV